ncbi:SUMF1/EgtB/PvdO family nonheme iron enzyme [Candidatus Chloroploca sp. M-50]|uniref:SUMF1/EgtB/PvdO family nonheme iron enzyme n=1 Tax=Candidatus Chloroploca mongolica TaxID=2528176 RepID=A0ABS4DGJ9_9CHLR|nr:SUMF1/EgtB/PvdO family nonheme iron enzyme [Candidatus Chloroploca mongolica]MBP1468557.1 SUMF1/EgtB/PvdO family nonheme iron enzyme [Candidatus Chloroploca mongolica]
MTQRRDELSAELAALEEELAATTHPRTRARLEADRAAVLEALAALAGEPPPAPASPPAPVDQSGQAGGLSLGAGNTIQGGVTTGDVIARDKYAQQIGTVHAGRDAFVAQQQTFNYYGASVEDVAPLLHTYLVELVGSCARLSLAEVAATDPKQTPLHLEAVYVGLEVQRQVEVPPPEPAAVRERAIRVIQGWGFAGVEAYAETYEVTVERALQFVTEQLGPAATHRRVRALETLAAQRCLVLTGAPGSGKSSFLNYLSICLAEAHGGASEALARLEPDWPHGPLLPVRALLRAFGAWVDAQPTHHRAASELFWEWLEHGARLSARLVGHLRQAFAHGQAMLLLDGLDEVPRGVEGATVRRVRAALDELGRGAGRVLVTCRVLDYQQPERQLATWPVEELAPLSSALREALIDRWLQSLEALQRLERGSAAVLATRLHQALHRRPELRRLAGNPLLLTMMIRLQAYDGNLPEEQVTLYRRSVELLLLQWRQDAAGRVALGEVLELPGWSESALNRLLDHLAYGAHARSVAGDGEQGADLPCEIVLQTAAAFFALFDPDRRYERAEKFLTYLNAHSNGILQRHDQQIYRFPHRTFQEYLAGRRLLSDEGWPDEQPEFVDRALACSARGPQWREAVLLAVSQHALEGRLRPVFSLATELVQRARANQTAADRILAAEVLAEVGHVRVAQQRPELWAMLQAELTHVIEACATADQARFPVVERVRAGFLLGTLGDQRMPVSLAAWQQRLTEREVPGAQAYFRLIPAGAYRIGSDADDPDAYDDERPQHLVPIPDAFWIARLPITNAQWQVWVAQGGEAAPFADDDDLNHPNQPVVGVTWEEAKAYCAWLTRELAAALPVGWVIRLPTEVEWEAAARGQAARRYPWGDTWREDSAAMADDRATRGASWTVPVGCYPTGATPEGLLDMAGNVWQWTLDRYHSYPGSEKPFTRETLVVVRGGGYNTDRTLVRCGARGWNHPYYTLHDQGFRVVVSPLVRTDVLNAGF